MFVRVGKGRPYAIDNANAIECRIIFRAVSKIKSIKIQWKSFSKDNFAASKYLLKASRPL